MVLQRLALVALLLIAGAALSDSKIEHLLAAESPPAGVVFEVIEEDEDALDRVLPAANRHAAALRERFPGLPVAVVTHGQEQFGLLSNESSGPLASIHTEARALGDADVDLHVCGAHASWYGHGPEDFPDYVDVSPSGPALLNDYRALGYEIIRLRQDDISLD
jgi:intracellular sulfur oxidation DsrE/DsrF family protein